MHRKLYEEVMKNVYKFPKFSKVLAYKIFKNVFLPQGRTSNLTMHVPTSP